ncbi:MAG: response regulator, partial [Myxococcota bacterium]
MGAGVTVRVVVGDDSSIFREVAREVLEGDGDIAVVGEAVDGPDTIAAVRRHRPDLLLVDLQMPGMSGLSAIEQVMAGSPVPIVLITARRGDDTLAFEAMRRGALEVLDKGVVAQRPAWLREQVRQLARVPVVRRPAARPAQATAGV